MPQAATDPVLQAQITAQAPQHRATPLSTPDPADPKWRFMWRIGPRPAHTAFAEFIANPVIPAGKHMLRLLFFRSVRSSVLVRNQPQRMPRCHIAIITNINAAEWKKHNKRVLCTSVIPIYSLFDCAFARSDLMSYFNSCNLSKAPRQGALSIQAVLQDGCSYRAS